MKRFNELKVGSKVYVIYNKLYGDRERDLAEYDIVEGEITYNDRYEHMEMVSFGNPYAELERLVHEWYIIKVNVPILSEEYMRSYSDYEIGKGYMVMCSDYGSVKPSVTVFVSKTEAREFIIDSCKWHIKRFDETIARYVLKKKLLKQSIRNVK